MAHYSLAEYQRLILLMHRLREVWGTEVFIEAEAQDLAIAVLPRDGSPTPQWRAYIGGKSWLEVSAMMARVVHSLRKPECG